ncbi:MAG: hypothetical protein HWN67_22870 [Candidatus Helarchaeota archaeon]|nr:hypothetical protein [Candidatus Helarchaeota archaeon]
MKNLYLDTNVIISYLRKNDIFNDLSNKIMNYNNFERIGSTLTILEISSVISKQFDNIEINEAKIKNWDNLSIVEKKLLVIYYFTTKIPVKFYFTSNNEKFYIKDQDLSINVDFSKAIRIAPFFNLRTIDNLQLSSALNIRDIKNIHLDYFVTTDEVILDNAKEIQKLTHVTIIHSEKLIEIEKI